MKKINLIISMLVVFGLILTACQSATPVATEPPVSEPDVTEAPAPTQEPTKAPVATEAPAPTDVPTEAPVVEEPIEIAFFVPWTEDVWYVAAIEGAKMRAEELGVKLQVFDAGYKVETQVQQFDTAMASKPDAIVLSSVDPAAMIPSVERARDAGIVVVVYDRPIWETAKLDALLILDTPGIGTQSCEAIAEYLTNKYGEPKGKVIRAFGDLADTWVTDISSGWDPCMEQYPNIEIISAMSGPWEPEQSAANVEQILVTDTDVDAIFLDSDWLGSGITRVLEAQGFGKVGEDNHIFYVGCGGMPQALDYIREGWMDTTLNNPVPDFAAAAIGVATVLVKGEELPSEWVQEGAAWSPALITIAEPTEDKPYAGPVLDMMNFFVDSTNVDDPTLWGNLVAE